MNYSPVYKQFHTDSTSEVLIVLYLYFHRRGSNEAYSIVLSIQSFTANTRHGIYIKPNHSHSIARKFIPMVAALGNRQTKECFPEHCNVKLFKSTVILSYLPKSTIITLIKISHSVTLCFECLLAHVFGE